MAESLRPNDDYDNEQRTAPVLQYRPKEFDPFLPAKSAETVMGSVSIRLSLFAWIVAIALVLTQDQKSTSRYLIDDFVANMGALAWLSSTILAIRLLRYRVKRGRIALLLDAFLFCYAALFMRAINK